MKRIDGYHPSPLYQQRIERFEEAIGQPIRSWLRENVAKGYGQRALAETVGIGYFPMGQLLRQHGLRTTGHYRPVHHAGVSIRAYVRLRGGDRAMEDRVRRRVDKGMSLPEAWIAAQGK